MVNLGTWTCFLGAETVVTWNLLGLPFSRKSKEEIVFIIFASGKTGSGSDKARRGWRKVSLVSRHHHWWPLGPNLSPLVGCYAAPLPSPSPPWSTPPSSSSAPPSPPPPSSPPPWKSHHPQHSHQVKTYSSWQVGVLCHHEGSCLGPWCPRGNFCCCYHSLPAV